MSFTITSDRRELTDALRKLLRVVPRAARETLPYQVVRMSRTTGVIVLTAWSKDMNLDLVLRPPGDGDGSVVVPIRLLAGIVGRLRAGPVVISATDLRLTVTSGRFTAALDSVDSDDDLRVHQDHPSTVITTLPAAVLSEGVQHMALALEHPRAWLPGDSSMQIDSSDRSTVFRATDGTQLAEAHVPVPETAEHRSHRAVVVPTRMADNLVGLLPASGEVSIEASGGWVNVSSADFILRAGSMASSFPDYEPMRSADTSHFAQVSRRALVAAIERASLVAGRNAAPRARCRFDTGQITLTVRERTRGDAIQHCPAAVQGPTVELGFHLWGLLAVLRTLQGPRVVISFGPEDGPVTFATPSRPWFRYYLLPLVGASLPPGLQRADRRDRDHPHGPDELF